MSHLSVPELEAVLGLDVDPEFEKEAAFVVDSKGVATKAMHGPMMMASNDAQRAQLARRQAAKKGKKLLKAVRKVAAAEPATVPNTGNVEYGGDVNTGNPKPPEWPRAAMGVDAAGRKATPAEAKKQSDTATPQHVEPKTASLKMAVSGSRLRMMRSALKGKS